MLGDKKNHNVNQTNTRGSCSRMQRFTSQQTITMDEHFYTENDNENQHYFNVEEEF